MESGQSAVESKFYPETLSSLVDWQSALRMVRQRGPDGPPVGLEICPETSLPLGSGVGVLRIVRY